MIPREFPQPDPGREVLKTLPEAAQKFDDKTGVQRAADKIQRYYYCGICGGWLAGDPSMHAEDTRKMHGRFGTVYQCRKCMNEITFVPYNKL